MTWEEISKELFEKRTAKRFKFNGRTNCIEYDNESILLDSYGEDIEELLNELHEEVMDLRSENTKFKLIVSEIIEDMQKYVDDNQLVYINQSYVDWIKKEVDTTLYSQKKELEE